MPHKWEHERKKGSITSSLKVDRQSRVGSRKSKKFRSISRSLILCNTKDTDDGSSPDEKCPDPIEISTSWDQEKIDSCPRLQVLCTSEPDDSTPYPLVITSMIQSKDDGSESCKNMRRKFFIQVGNSLIIVYFMFQWFHESQGTEDTPLILGDHEPAAVQLGINSTESVLHSLLGCRVSPLHSAD